ncbi:hypothetical protein [Bacillus ectoiniformans]|uniref:hypothetical protein n=1 Tax=Bacillus ectoiniformans TaxID=1494429 RepID=UPI0019584B52|nr:hypothetical protein [Bacillus ectoiniformans]
MKGLSILGVMFGAMIVWYFVLAGAVHSFQPEHEYLYFQPGLGAIIIPFIYAFFLGLSTFFMIGRLLKWKENKRTYRKQSLYWNGFSSKKEIVTWVILPNLILAPFMYMAMDNYLLVTEKEIVIAPFWDLDSQRYSWESVDSVELGYDYDEGRYFGYYDLYLLDGNSWDLWADGEEAAGELLNVDCWAKTQGVEKEFWSQPFRDVEKLADDVNYAEADIIELFELDRGYQ